MASEPNGLPLLLSQPPYVQAGIACIPGWLSGHLLKKFGGAAACAVAGGSLLLLYLHNKGYVTVHWTAINKDVKQWKETTSNIQREHQEGFKKVLKKMKCFAQTHQYLSLGFMAGFGLGFLL
ncbi:FUN14 domain-containing protein 1-like [Oscarella lobularis]|uniref:FUN14 domain-containing protein 1-like n=1 Tax=Oscarella lobularis TaxID=121494 RepID=UPI003313956B